MMRFYYGFTHPRNDIFKLSIILLTLVGCHMTKNSAEGAIQFDKQGHRGARGLIPENTIPAMYKAVDLGVNTLEMDAVITKDNEVVLSHEPFFNHEISTKPDGNPVLEEEEKSLNIYQMSYEQVKGFDVGLRGNPRFPRQHKMACNKPRLADLIDSVEAYCRSKKLPLPAYNIETKSQPSTDGIFHPAPAEFVDLLVNVLQKKSILDRVIIQSFDPRTLQYLHKKFPNIKTALLIEDFDKASLQQQIEKLGFVPTIYSPHFLLVTDQLIKECHNKNIKVIPWTVNDKPGIERLKKMGVDGVISDYPDLF